MKTNSYRSLGLFFLTVLLLLPTMVRAAIAPVEEVSLESESTLLVRSDRIAPRIAISLLVRAGAADETTANSGWRQVLTNAMLQATQLGKLDSLAIESKEQNTVTISDWEKALDVWGGELGASVDDDAIEFWITGDSAHTDELLQILLQIAQNPRLSDDDLTAARRHILSVQDQAKDGVVSQATHALAQQLYSDSEGTPLAYALPDFGNFESLSDFDNTQLREQHAKYFSPDRFIFGVAGNANSARIATQLNRLIKSSDSRKPAESKPEFAVHSANVSPSKVYGSDRGSWVFTAFRVPSANELTPTQNAAFEVLSAALVGSSHARLTQRLLEDSEESLAAQTGAQWLKRRFAGELTLFAQTDDAEAVRKALLEEVARLSEAPLSSAELQGAKNYAHGQWAVNRSTLHERSFATALAALHSSTPDSDWPQYLQEVSAAQIQEMARQYLTAPATVFLLPQE